ncbi:CHAD domain-containing protein [Arhodomonas sp. SL1]|uniref:CHAD domain-containing protein n=1 Tax=Arhodomonas sp. SL1 TaxID=3425691 RepID=UPI003F883EB5
MAYRLDPQCDADEEVRRIAGECIAWARDALALPAERRAEGVHEARKRLKELRALLRLIRPRLGKHRFRRENARFRDIARGLSEMRDADALLEAWDAMAVAEPTRFSRAAMRRVRDRLVSRRDAGVGEGGPAEAIEGAHSALTEAATGVSEWPLGARGFALVREGLHRSYRDGGRRLAVLDDGLTDAGLHEWRKRVKDHWYHTCLLERCWPAMLGARRRLLKQLSDALGDDHDLAMLQALMDVEPGVFGPASTRRAVARAVARRRATLQADAFAVGRRLYAETPRALVIRWRAYWRLTRAGNGPATSKP